MIPKTIDHVNIAIEIVQSCPRSDLVEDLRTIVDSMPDLKQASKKDYKVQVLYRKLQEMKLHVETCQLLRDDGNTVVPLSVCILCVFIVCFPSSDPCVCPMYGTSSLMELFVSFLGCFGAFVFLSRGAFLQQCAGV